MNIFVFLIHVLLAPTLNHKEHTYVVHTHLLLRHLVPQFYLIGTYTRYAQRVTCDYNTFMVVVVVREFVYYLTVALDNSFMCPNIISGFLSLADPKTKCCLRFRIFLVPTTSPLY